MTPTEAEAPPELMTAEEFYERYAGCSGVELIDGVVVWKGMNRPTPGGLRVPRFKHGVVSHNADALIGGFIRANRLGWVAINDTFVPVRRNPDRVRGADMLYVSYTRLPRGPIPDDLVVIPDLVVEVVSPTNTWTEIFTKVGEYLRAGVTAVLVLDPNSATATVYRGTTGQTTLRSGDDLTLPDILPGFTVPVADFFSA